MKKYKRIAMFGGTFSPIHNGHLAALSAYIDVVKPDAVYVMPTAFPPHKVREDSATDEDRLKMLQLAISGLNVDCEIVVSDMEIKRGGKSYTVDTVEELLNISNEVVFFCGTDMLLTVDKWYMHERLLKIASVAYMQREDDLRYDAAVSAKARELKEKYNTNTIALPPISDEISSSIVRQAVRDGKDISEFVPESVAGYITKHKLYI